MSTITNRDEVVNRVPNSIAFSNSMLCCCAYVVAVTGTCLTSLALQIEKTAMTEENERLLRELETVRRPSTGRAGAQAEISLMRKELAAAKAEAQAAREEREKVQEEVESMRMEVERKKKSIGDLENK